MNPRWIAAGAALLLAALLAFALWPESTPKQFQTRTQTDCTQDTECGNGMVCCQGACAATCQDNPDPTTPPPGGDTHRLPGAKRDIDQLLANRLPARPRDKRLKPAPDGTCKKVLDCQTQLMGCDTSAGLCLEPSICVNDIDCKDGRVCQHGKCVDEVEGCRFEDCRKVGYCNVEFMECEKYQCKTNADCAGTRQCDTRQGLCVDCLRDEHCPGDSKCTDTWICLDNKNGCFGDGNCDEGFACNPGTNLCQRATCVDDDREENDKWNQAVDLEPGEHKLMSCSGDKDWFKIELTEGEGFLVHITYDNKPGQLDLRLHDVNGQEIDRAGDNKLTGDVTMARERVNEDTILYLKVNHTTGVGVPYTLDYSVWPDGFCLNDDHEPNEVAQDGKVLPPRFRWDMKMCAFDDDWYRQPVEAGKEIKITFDITSGEPFRVDIFRDNEEKPFWSDETTLAAKYFKHTPDRTGDLYIRVSPLFAQTETIYGVRIEPPAQQ